MRIHSQECMKHAMTATGALLGAAGGAFVAVTISNKNPFLCKAIVDYITGTGGHPIAAAMNCLAVELSTGASVGAIIGWTLADRLAQRILGGNPIRAN